MCSRLALLGLLLMLLSPAAVLAQGGHELELGIYTGHVDFDRDIRFDDDMVLGVRADLGITDWFRMGVGLGQIEAHDTLRDVWSRIVLVTLSGRMEPWSRWRVSPGALLGVSFMGFTESERSDALSEGLDLAPTVRWNLSPSWILRADWLLRIQSFKVEQLDYFGRPTGERKETGYLWSHLLRVGVSHAF